jgi:acetylornithine deacetylase/succinyl-diaminopimelate desuccinylase-like protein
MTADALASAVHRLMPRAWADLERLVAIPSVASEDRLPVPAGRAGAELVAALYREVGIEDIQLVDADDGSVVVVGHRDGPAGAPRVLLYAHYDVQPPGDTGTWSSDPWTLTERGGRWYGRGAADCKGNLVMHLTALRALRDVDGGWPLELTVVCEGSEEMSTGGLERLVAAQPELFAADVIVVADTGNVEAGVPTVTTSLRGTGSVLVTVRTMAGPVHSGAFGGAAPDAMAALIRALDTLRDDQGATTVTGVPADGRWTGAAYPVERFRSDAGVLDGVDVIGRGDVADSLWARPVATVLAIEGPAVKDVTASVQGEARAVVNLRVPPGVDAAAAQQRLVDQLTAAVPWNARITVEPKTLGRPFAARTDGPAYAALATAMEQAYGRPMVQQGQGGAIPLCVALAEAHPEAEILLIGVEEPACRIHAPDESVSPDELRRTAVAEALLMRALGAAGRGP